MTTQARGEQHNIPNVDTSLPTLLDGLAMSTVTTCRIPKKFVLEVAVASGTPTLTIVGSSTEAGTVWGPFGAALNAGATFAVGTYFFIVENLAALRRVGLLISAGTATATLTALLENGD